MATIKRIVIRGAVSNTNNFQVSLVKNKENIEI